jgi:hypothetical protein
MAWNRARRLGEADKKESEADEDSDEDEKKKEMKKNRKEMQRTEILMLGPLKMRRARRKSHSLEGAQKLLATTQTKEAS